jgi:hypothetical protein
MFLVLNADAAEKKDPMRCLMANSMVTGASISSGLDGVSFADQLTVKHSANKKLIREAYPGVTGEAIVTYPSFLKGMKSASFVMALDFFYWDQFTCREEGWESRLNQTLSVLFDRSVKVGVPLLVGTLTQGKDLFNKVRFVSGCGDQINLKVKEACDRNPKKCLLIDMDELFKHVKTHFAPKIAEHKVPQERVKYIKDHITRDAIHPRTTAYSVIAQYLDQAIQSSALECK